ncbi:MAG: DUF1565 domain-containing protein [Lentisphaerae bacterium]|nr:DUF1565 domain-containing protein [Lentisphaerota bacterium]MBT5608455.1 DUF1565 domain-containing protein [Lentisphaerota bacterium]MBT7055144.1 DUF1565 domain-containing protein [Lentisphaerota bacterium]
MIQPNSALKDHVATRDPRADDTNAGSSAAPFKTISRATEKATGGDVVLIHGGVYRESVTVTTGGTEERPVRFAAAPMANVVITGADVLTDWNREQDDAHVYSTPWPYRFITWYEGGHHPHNDFHKVIGRCEQVHLNRYPLLQVLERDKLSRGTFYIDLEAKRLFIWDRANREPGTGSTVVEGSHRAVLWSCKVDYVQVRGIRFRFASNRAQEGAVQMLGNHGLMEDCTVERVNALGAILGGKGNTVRRCLFQDNGWDGFDAGAQDLLMTGCTVRNNNTKGWNRDWGGGGNKIVLSRNVILEKCRFTGNRGHGVWFDIGNEDCVVRNCLIADNENAGIFYEISYGLHAHDNVIIGNGLAPRDRAWGANGGISLSSSPNCLIERNLIVANKEGIQFREQTRTTPRIGQRDKQVRVWNHDHTIRNNIIAHNRDAQVAGWFAKPHLFHWPKAAGKQTAEQGQEPPKGMSLEDMGFVLEHNLFAMRHGELLYQWGCTWDEHLKLSRLQDVWQQLGLERGSLQAPLQFADWHARDLRLPADSPALTGKRYPRGDVPGVRLGVVTD